MVIRRWTTQEMVSLSGALTNPTHEYGRTLAGVPELAGLLPRLNTVHDQLVATYGDSVASRLAPVIAAQARVDARHDGWARVIYYTLEAHIHQAQTLGDTARAMALETLRDLLFPDGLKLVSYSYRDEAGQAVILSERITPDVEQVLSGIPVQGSDLLCILGNLFAAARELGSLEEQRTRIRQEVRDITPARARIEWGQIMAILYRLLELNRDTTPGVDDILARMSDVDRGAKLRVRNGNAEDPAEDTGADDIDDESGDGDGSGDGIGDGDGDGSGDSSSGDGDGDGSGDGDGIGSGSGDGIRDAVGN